MQLSESLASSNVFSLTLRLPASWNGESARRSRKNLEILQRNRALGLEQQHRRTRDRLTMPTVRVKALTEATPSLPEIETLAPTTSRFAKQTDLFLCALGFEPRCASIPEFLAQNGFKAARALYFEYNTNRADNQANRAELVQQMAQLSPDVVRLDADEQGAAQPLRNLLASTVAGAAAAETANSVLLDVSVASSALLMTCMKVLLEFDVDSKILYDEAPVYHRRTRNTNSTRPSGGRVMSWVWNAA